MPIFDKLKSIFVVEDDSPSPRSAKDNPESKREQTPTTNARPIQITGQSSEKFLEILSQVLEKNNQPGFDYFEFRKAVLSVGKLQAMDEATQYRTAFAAAQAMNVQPNLLVESAKKYLAVLEMEEQNFNQSANQFLSSQVKSKETESNQLQEGIKQKEGQIEQLNKELVENRHRLNALQAELANAKSKVESNKANFHSSYLAVVDQIQQDVKKMEQYLK
ncbi:MAG: hypothetical protein M3Q56_04980 [Bacteroidota bacterium]|nr:hypothetical protein [Bacteroidota bacterium]